MNAHSAGEVCTGARELEHGHAAEAEPHCADTAIDLRLTPQRLQASVGTLHQLLRVVAQADHRCHHAFAIPRDSTSEHVAGQDDVAKPRVSHRLLARMLVEASAAVDEEDSRTVALDGIRPGDEAVEAGGSIGVRQRFRFDF
ncbi:MAG TPA: hypothetical protein VE219_01430 [Candidatus Sulfotelmatobacter sp.]|nr:hypothetical protein [Candidatus Sulfotelmatobacter sp.]